VCREAETLLRHLDSRPVGSRRVAARRHSNATASPFKRRPVHEVFCGPRSAGSGERGATASSE
jgi:hypothetical protein